MSAPVGNTANSTEPYNCGYVRTRPDSSAVAGIFAYDACMPFFYNETFHDYEKAFAYTLYGGCTCRFYSSAVQGCGRDLPAEEYTGSTDRWNEPLFADPQPIW
ncbi:hypothetical protein E8E11_011289 [Didymella keratinophila]|nr:hypothetical protein E8E11_011289 [Didymella keratinophila]